VAFTEDGVARGEMAPVAFDEARAILVGEGRLFGHHAGATLPQVSRRLPVRTRPWYRRRRKMSRTATLARTTKETAIEVTVDLDGSGAADIETPIPFLSHMLEQIAKHGLVDLKVRATGDVQIDGHHTTEDLAFVLGQAVARALGDKAK